mmetsp:Transcript_18809/g.45444  ORF Transcript_18809/g.45444 Transcript_18809/m.45444 type:complete len:217 (-) Transcript_18809:492-1142(-)
MVIFKNAGNNPRSSVTCSSKSFRIVISLRRWHNEFVVVFVVMVVTVAVVVVWMFSELSFFSSPCSLSLSSMSLRLFFFSLSLILVTEDGHINNIVGSWISTTSRSSSIQPSWLSSIRYLTVDGVSFIRRNFFLFSLPIFTIPLCWKSGTGSFVVEDLCFVDLICSSCWGNDAGPRLTLAPSNMNETELDCGILRSVDEYRTSNLSSNSQCNSVEGK